MTKRHIEKGKLLNNINLAAFTSWRVGGDAELFYWPVDLDDLQQFLRKLDPEIPVTWLGLGSNVLIRDGGIPGVTIITQGALCKMALGEQQTVFAQAGVSCAQVARFSGRHNLMGGEFLAGIPGTVGGALKMNAGAFGGETWQVVKQVTTLHRHGLLTRRTPNEFDIAYRHLEGLAENEWFVGCEFQFQRGDNKTGLAKIKALLTHRAQTQPTGEPSCGSVFRNPQGDFAARMIEGLGLKNHRVGQAVVSEKHANFIINLGGASAADIEILIDHLQSQVKSHYGVELQREVLILGQYK